MEHGSKLWLAWLARVIEVLPAAGVRDETFDELDRLRDRYIAAVHTVVAERLRTAGGRRPAADTHR